MTQQVPCKLWEDLHRCHRTRPLGGPYVCTLEGGEVNTIGPPETPPWVQESVDHCVPISSPKQTVLCFMNSSEGLVGLSCSHHGNREVSNACLYCLSLVCSPACSLGLLSKWAASTQAFCHGLCCQEHKQRCFYFGRFFFFRYMCMCVFTGPWCIMHFPAVCPNLWKTLERLFSSEPK